MRPTTGGVTTIEYDVHSPEPLSCISVAYVAKELVKHLLFMRNQAPALIDELTAKADTAIIADTLRRKGTGDRRTSKFIGKVEGIMAALTPALFSLDNPTCMHILFGPSPLRPVEVYSLSCKTAQLSDDGAGATQREDQVARDVSRKVLRSLIMHTAGGPEGKAASGPTKLFVMMRAPEQSEAPPGFLPKRTFQMKQRRGLQVHMNLKHAEACEVEAACCSADPETGAGSMAGGNLEITHSTAGGPQTDAQGLLWYQCNAHVKGICASGGPATGVSDFM